MPQFIQIDDIAVNVDTIKVVRTYQVAGKTRVSISLLDGKDEITLTEGRANRFLRWWKKEAEVHII